jgi:hypothetical protein
MVKKEQMFGDAEENKDLMLLGQGDIRSTPELGTRISGM